MALNISPRVTADARLFLGVRRDRFSLEIGAEATYPSTDRRWDGSGFRYMLIGGTVALCGHRQRFAACALGRASQARATGLGVDRPHSPTGFLAHAGLRLAANFPLGTSWFIAARIEGLARLMSSTVVLNRVAVWEMPRLGGLAGLDLVARFW